jgi:hypothetical protein
MYHLRIGSFNAARKGGEGEGGTLGTIRTPHPVTYMTHPHKHTPLPYSCTYITDSHPVARVFSGSLYLCFMLTFFMLSATILIHKNMMNSSFTLPNFAVDNLGLTGGLSLQALSLIKTAYLYFMSYAILKAVLIRKSSSHSFKVSGRASRALKFLLLAILILNFILKFKFKFKFKVNLSIIQ